MPSTNGSSWRPGRPDHGAVRLRVLCFPHAGGGASAFRGWTRDQLPGVDVRAVQLPGREDRIREPFPEDILGLAGTLCEALLPSLDVPYVLVGNSLGALVAFELARLFQRRYFLPPIRLVVAAARPPGTDRRPAVSGLADRELAAEIQDRYGGIPGEIMRDPLHLAAFLPALRADMAMFEQYRPPPGPVLECPVTAVVGASDADMSCSDLVGWSAFTVGGLHCMELPGDHFALLGCRDQVLGPIYAEAALLQPAGPRSPIGPDLVRVPDLMRVSEPAALTC